MTSTICLVNFLYFYMLGSSHYVFFLQQQLEEQPSKSRISESGKDMYESNIANQSLCKISKAELLDLKAKALDLKAEMRDLKAKVDEREAYLKAEA